MRRKKVTPILQMSQTECGLCAATMLMEFYNVKIKIHDITTKFAVGRDGASIVDLKNIFKYYNFKTSLYEVNGGIDKISESSLPCIAYHVKGHFIVIEKVNKQNIVILDPAIGRMRISKEKLAQDYKNIIIKIHPGANFEKKNTRKNEFAIIKEAIFKNKLLVGQTVLTAIFVYALMLIVPIMLKEIVDNYLQVGELDNIIVRLTYCIGLSSVAYFIINRVKMFAGIKLSVEVDKYLTKKVINKLFKNKFEYYLNRTSSDIQYRLALLKSLKMVISEVVIQTLLDVGSMIVILLYVLQYQLEYALLLTVITVLVLGISILVRDRMLMVKNEEIARESKLQIQQYDIFRSIFDVKVLGLSKVKEKVWEESYDEYIGSHNKSQMFSAFYRNILSYISIYVPIFIPILGIWMSSIYNNNQLGTIISLQSLTGVYITGLISISQLVESVTSVKSFIARIEDILVQDDEKDGDKEIELKGNINVENLHFTYPGAKQEVLSDINFQVKEGESLGIVGESGSGKSTLFYILLGAYDDYKGSVTYEGVELKSLNKDNFRKQAGAVPQNSLLFNGSIKENMTQNPDITDKEIYDVLKMVSLFDFVKELPMNINTIISENAFNFSGGQKQRLALARAIINKKAVLFLDEATSSLDNLTEQRIVDYLNTVSHTKIVIAHRLSTIKDCDRILVMKNGQIVESGNHYQLINIKGEYYRMYYKDLGSEGLYENTN